MKTFDFDGKQVTLTDEQIEVCKKAGDALVIAGITKDYPESLVRLGLIKRRGRGAQILPFGWFCLKLSPVYNAGK